MNKTKKILLLVLCAALLVSATIAGTVAYLTSQAKVNNTFTSGFVGLSLDEAKVDRMGNAEGIRWQPTAADPEQEYHLLPGHSYTKDPTVTVTAGSEESYVRMIVAVEFDQALTDAELATNLDSIFAGYDAAKWARHAKTLSADGKTITYEYRYHTTVDGFDGDAKVALKLEPLFTGFTIPGTYTNEQIAFLNGMTINIEAHAIQKDGFSDADKAWTAFGLQYSNP